jgi:prepilin-type N-terminal cleavage/methylation domain-containing protein
MGKKQGFTLIELLVVIAIIALLLSILMPALKRVKVQARIVICRSNMRQWGLAWQTYATDNNGVLASSVGSFSGVYPANVWLYNDAALGNKGQFSAEMLSSYIPGANMDRNDLGPGGNPEIADVWVCPSNRNQEGFTDYVRGNFRNNSPYFIGMYAFYGRVDKWEAAASRPQDLTGKHMSSRRLLMSDTMYNWLATGAPRWAYNHGEDGGRVHAIANPEPASITGANQMNGDLSATWKDGDEFDLPQMNAGQNNNIPCVRGGGSDVSYY